MWCGYACDFESVGSCCVVPCYALRPVPALYRTRAIEERRVQKRFCGEMWAVPTVGQKRMEKTGKDVRCPLPHQRRTLTAVTGTAVATLVIARVPAVSVVLRLPAGHVLLLVRPPMDQGGRLASRIRRARPCLRPSRSLCVAPFSAPELPHCVRPPH